MSSHILPSGLQALTLSLVLASATLPVFVQATETGATVSLVDLSIEELARLPVTSVSRRPSPVATAPASIYVITGEDIRRSGVTSLPEALRLAPNLQVARVNARSYAITARGFNNSTANKFLVLIDGRTVYSPLFSGVFWDSQDVVLEDIERIEVISGPGSTLWGANAVNGVINITTKPAGATQGTLLSVGASMEETQLVSRYGGQLRDGAHFRVYAKHHRHDDVTNAEGLPSYSGIERTTAGFRSDWNEVGRNFTLQSDLLSARLQTRPGRGDAEVTGAHVLTRLRQELDGGSEALVQMYFDHQQRYQPGAFDEHLNTLDLDLQHSVHVGRRHNLVWGGGFRHADDQVENGASFAFLPHHKVMNWANLFAQNDIDMFDAVHLTLGAKFERNPYTGWESLPNVRLSYAPRGASYLFWGALSRSVRSPSRFDREFFIPGDPEIVNGEPIYSHTSDGEFQAEIARVAEFGYRAQPRDDLSFSATWFFSRYERLRTLETDDGTTRFRNLAEADSYGVEVWGGWQVNNHWRLTAGMVAQDLDMDLLPQSNDTLGATNIGSRDPEIYWQLRSSLALTDNLEVEAFFRHVGELGEETTATPGYSSLDVRCGWQLGPALELSLVGQNLLDASHPEFGVAPDYSEFRRALYVKVLWEL